MFNNKNKVYLPFLIMTLFFAVLLLVLFFIDPSDIRSPEGEFLLPGNALVESIYPLFIIPILLVCAYLSLFFTDKIFLRIYVSTLGRNRKIGLAEHRELSNSTLAKRIFLRSLILIFFILNISYTLVSQEVIVKIMRSPNPGAGYFVPDPSLMYALAWILAIPCAFILIPVWVMNDIGLVASKKDPELDLNT